MTTLAAPRNRTSRIGSAAAAAEISRPKPRARGWFKFFADEPLYHYPMDRFSIISPILYRSEHTVIHVGGGPKRNHPSEVNLNIVPMAGVDLCGAAEALPFDDHSVDVIISNAVLEHVEHFDATLREMDRVLKPGGFVYIEIPLMQHYHTGDAYGVRFEDYRRLTKAGLRQAFSFCTPVDVAPCVGPISATLQVFFSMLSDLSTNRLYRKTVAALYHGLGNPLVRLDALLSDAAIRRSRVPSGLYFFGRKRDALAPLLERMPGPTSLCPSDALARLTLVEQLPDRLRVRIENRGRTIWLRESPLSWGMVQIGLQHVSGTAVDRDFRRVRLPHDVHPGQTLEISLDISAFEGASAVSIDLVNEGICWFAQRGTRPLRVPLGMG